MTSPSMPDQPQAQSAAARPALDPNEAIWQSFMSDPEGYLKSAITSVIQQEMVLLREEMQLKNALAMARQRYPELAKLENYLMQEIIAILESNPDSEAQSWDDLVEKSLTQLGGKFKAVAGQAAVNPTNPVNTLMETAGVRQPQAVVPEFSREQLAKMTLQEFLQNETAINEAMRQNRIR